MLKKLPLILLTFVLVQSLIWSKEQDFMSDAAAVRLSFSGSPKQTLEGTSAELGLEQWTIITPLFYKKSGSWSFAGGLRYEATNMECSDTSLLDEDWLQSVDFPLLLITCIVVQVL